MASQVVQRVLPLLAAAAIGAGAVVLYRGWGGSAVNSVADSERVVREFVQTASTRVREFRRVLRTPIANTARDPAALAAALAAIDQQSARTMAAVEADAKQALTQIEDAEGIGLQTERNRVDRLRERWRQTNEFIAQITEEAKEQARGPSADAGAPGAQPTRDEQSR